MIPAGNLAGGFRRTLWTPANLPTPPALWFNDDSSITTVSGMVSQWNDISGNNYHFSQSTSTQRPEPLAAALNGRRVIRFDGVNDYLASSATGARNLCRNQANLAHFGVILRRAAGGNTNAIVLYNSSNASGSRSTVAVNGAGGGETDKVRFIQRSTDAGGAAVLTQATAINGSWQIFGARAEISNTDGYLHINGTLDQSSTSFTSGTATSDTAANIGPSLGAAEASGGAPTGGTPAAVDVAEIMTIRAQLTTANVERLEGYLAHRWGLTGNLPSDHPYKTEPPYA